MDWYGLDSSLGVKVAVTSMQGVAVLWLAKRDLG